MRRFRALIKKEITHMVRDPRTLIFIFIMPILQLVLLGYANSTDVKNVPTVIFNQDNSPVEPVTAGLLLCNRLFLLRLFGLQPDRTGHNDRGWKGQSRHRDPS